MRRRFFDRFRREAEQYPPDEHADSTDTVRNVAFDKIIDRRMFLTRLAYRVPFFLMEFFLILLLTLGAPIGAGWVLIAGMKIIAEDFPDAVQMLSYWLLGVVTIGGAGITLVGIAAVWSALKDSAIRLTKLIRERK